jgi:phage terminase large subunit-like protein
VIAIDPATSSNAGSDETGIVACAIDAEGFGYVLDDASGVMRPEEWAKSAVSLYNYYKADCIVAEKNQGGEMVEAVIRAVNQNISIKLVHASRGKVVRAEPIAALYARRRVRHVKEFSELEDQMCSFSVGFDRSSAGYSPDRVDALVWGLTELFPGLVEDRAPGANLSYTMQDANLLDSW